MRPVYVFDLDGTLVDSMPIYSASILSVLDEEGIVYPPDTIKILTPLGNHGSAEYFIKQFGVRATKEALVARIEEKMIYAYSTLIRTKAGVPELLQRLHDMGARLFVLTASPHITTDVCLKNNGVWDLFETVWSVEDYGLTKSDPRIFYQLAERIGCAPAEIHYFDDSLIALRNAKAAGLITYGVYDAQSEEEIEEIKRLYGRFVPSFADFTE